jgi:hypothetical protein
MDLSRILTEASAVEQNAFRCDREGSVAEALSLYYDTVSRLQQALSLCPFNDPDGVAIERHIGEIQNRISYLSSLSSSTKPMIPLESHIQPVQLSIPVSPTHSSEPSGTSTMGAAAAIGGLGGLLLLGPIGLVAVCSFQLYVIHFLRELPERLLPQRVQMR